MPVELKTVSEGDLLRTKAVALNEVIEHWAICLVETGRDDFGLQYFNYFHLWLPNSNVEGGRGKADWMHREFGHFNEPRKLRFPSDGKHSLLYWEQSPAEMVETVDLALTQTKLLIPRIEQLQVKSDEEMDAFIADPDSFPLDSYQSAARQLFSYCFPTYVLLRAWGFSYLDLCG